MSSKACMQAGLAQAHQFSNHLLKDFQTPEQWTFQVHPGANHALWFAGHMAVTANFFISKIVPERVVDRSGYGELFGMGSQPSNNPADYPPVDEVLAYMRERQQTLRELLDQLDEAELEKPTPAGTPDFLPTIGSVFQVAIWHEGLHSGQVSVARRSMGHKPLMGG